MEKGEETKGKREMQLESPGDEQEKCLTIYNSLIMFAFCKLLFTYKFPAEQFILSSEHCTLSLNLAFVKIVLLTPKRGLTVIVNMLNCND